MYTQHFRLTELPFSIAPNPRYLYLSAQHREALAHLLYGIGVGGGFVVLTGEVGTGKTTLCRALLDQLPEDVDIALIFNPRLNSRELLAGICDELHIPYPGPRASLKQLIDALNAYLLDAHARGRRVIVLIDEAQNLRFDVLEQVRLLTNLETNQTKLLQIILVGQPELNQVLDRPNLRQLSQRITARYHLNPLTLAETRDYIRHRLKVAGGSEQEFTDAAMRAIHRRSNGIPRLINLMSDRALLGAYTLGKPRVTGPIARRASRELIPVRQSQTGWRVAGLLALLALTYAGAVWTKALPNPREGLAWLHALQGQIVPEPPAAKAKIAATNPEKRATETTAATPPVNSPLAAEAPKPLPAEPPKPPLPVASPKPPEIARPDFKALMINPKFDRESAIRPLAGVWDPKLALPAGDGCQLLSAQGYRCQNVQGSWVGFKSLNMPAVLEFKLPSGELRHAALLSQQDRQARLASGPQSELFELGDVLSYWTGNAWFIWKPPTREEALIWPGTEAVVIGWVRKVLAAPIAAGGREAVYDDKLRERVMAFQKAQGLKPDGIIGDQTLFYLQATDKAARIPRLSETRP
jgi:general secretion pathway protein A